jgi:hypothetical protein
MTPCTGISTYILSITVHHLHSLSEVPSVAEEGYNMDFFAIIHHTEKAYE